MSNIIGSGFTPYQTPAAKTGMSSARIADTSDPVSEFLAYQKMSPQEKIRDAFLKKYGLTEESLSNLPSEKRAEIEEQIKQEILKEFKGKLAEKGILVDLSA